MRFPQSRRSAVTSGPGSRRFATVGGQAGICPWGGTHLTSVLCFLAFMAVANTVGGGLRIAYRGDHHLHSLRLVIDLGVSVLLSAWALARVRAQWGQDAGLPAPILAEDDERERVASRPRTRRQAWLRVARSVLTAGLTALAVAIVVSQWGTLESAFGELRHLRWGMLRWAVYAEALAMIAFAQLTRLLLRAGGVNLGLGSMIGLTLASNAVALTLPGARPGPSPSPSINCAGGGCAGRSPPTRSRSLGCSRPWRWW